MFETPESKDKGVEKRGPSLLDIIKIDGRWAQVMGGGDVVSFFDTEGGYEPIDWSEYDLKEIYGSGSISVSLLERKYGEAFTPEEVERIQWESVDQKKYPELKKEVHVFGVYERKKTKK